MDFPSFLNAISAEAVVVLGEEHYNPSVLTAHGEIIDRLVSHHGVQGHFTVGWEFLNFSQQDQVNQAFDLYRQQGDALAFFQTFFGEQGGKRHLAYSPLIEVAERLDGVFVATNLERTHKREVIRGGLGAIDPQLIPPNMRLGEDPYFQRFSSVMRDHVPADKIPAYFLAQSLTDAVMAHHLLKAQSAGPHFLVVGSFHVDYFEGVVSHIADLAYGRSVISLRMVDGSSFDEEARLDFVRPHQDYGPLADFIVFAQGVDD